MRKKRCKYCDRIFETDMKYSKVCKKCKAKNHNNKIVDRLFNL